MLTRLKEDRKF